MPEKQRGESRPLNPVRDHFYREVAKRLKEVRIPYLVGGAAALRFYTGVYRDTKDLDLFCREADIPRILDLYRDHERYRGDYVDHRWIAKISHEDYTVDLVFNSYHGRLPVTESWLEHGRAGDLLGIETSYLGAEELIWTKSYMLHRSRFDGADINHILLRASPEIDWRRLLEVMVEDWELLLAQIVMFRYIYPNESALIPEFVVEELASRAREWRADSKEKICNGPLISRYPAQYGVDLEKWGYEAPAGSVDPEDEILDVLDPDTSHG